MDKIKAVFKKNLVYIVIILAILLCAGLLFLFTGAEGSKGDTESENSEDMEIVDVMVNVECSEADDDTQYNYVINPGKLSDMEIPAVHIADIAEAINKALQKKDVYGQKAQFISVSRRGTKVMFTVQVIDSEVKVSGEYDRSTGIVECE